MLDWIVVSFALAGRTYEEIRPCVLVYAAGGGARSVTPAAIFSFINIASSIFPLSFSLQHSPSSCRCCCPAVVWGGVGGGGGGGRSNSNLLNCLKSPNTYTIKQMPLKLAKIRVKPTHIAGIANNLVHRERCCANARTMGGAHPASSASVPAAIPQVARNVPTLV